MPSNTTNRPAPGPNPLSVKLAQIAGAAAALERSMKVPAELTTVQCILESGWLSKAPGLNPFGIKGNKENGKLLPTREDLTPDQLKKWQHPYTVVGPAGNGRTTVKTFDYFRIFPTLEAAFLAYGALLVNGTYFKARFQRYLQHRDLQKLLLDMSGKDGQPAYFTGQKYIESFNDILDQANVQAAIAAARKAA